MPSLDEFIKMLETMDSLSDEEKEQLKQDVLKNSMTGRKIEAGFSDYLVFLTMIVLIASVFVFFGYKLYLSLTEKERKREEKLKAKQSKKKK
uniref:Protein with signal anchor n=1 Tax=Culex tarsalis TaxID=7177 RepID=A0A1Q3G4A3_CULTA